MSVEYLADTNVVSETTKTQPDPQVLDWLTQQAPVITSAIVVYELARGVLRTSGRKRALLDEWLDALLSAGTRVLPLDQSVALAAAAIDQDARRRGRPSQRQRVLELGLRKSGAIRRG